MSTSRRQSAASGAKSKAPDEQKVDADTDTPAVAPAGVRAIKKYPNRRLYDTQTSSYITLVDIKDMVLACDNFLVLDAKSGEDLTRSILLQIILEEETGGVPMFSSQALAQIIRFYGNTMQGLMGNYLEKNIQSFIDLQARLTDNSVVNKLQAPLMQAPLMQNFMGGYMEQSRQMFTQMQEQMGKQAETLLGNFGSGLASTLTPKK
ncbi:polyhydroxyalkanoate synthesis repressor PhaR [Aquabacterium sp.]|uniref:polyhydroxyalkanoate synthesis repressor PhaR n=1 Tax=Aquabacterium sp. TaxID=1872578 RepID=UPI0019A23FBF|nr:polyhydroxyalkanoate synthesis repressor PhaR [Aquabacterium sp.]MBC7702038.1 polyhydroxyalkanoate synthesis repressor PhaR [Aquabacterium sp.]